VTGAAIDARPSRQRQRPTRSIVRTNKRHIARSRVISKKLTQSKYDKKTALRCSHKTRILPTGEKTGGLTGDVSRAKRGTRWSAPHRDLSSTSPSPEMAGMPQFRPLADKTN
jgi:hypothetical protein